MLLLVPPVERKRLVAIAAMMGLSVAAAARVLYAIAVTPGAPAGSQAGITPWHYGLAEGPVILRYLRLAIVPYGFTVDPDIRVPAVWLGLLAWLARGGRRCALPGGSGRGRERWFLAGLILLIPSSSIFPAADLAADRRMYLPMLGFAAAAGLLLDRVKPRALAPAAAIALTLVSVVRTEVWMSDETLWREAVERAPDKVRPKIQLARALPAAKALELLSQARDLAPHDPLVAAELGKTLLAEGQPRGRIAGVWARTGARSAGCAQLQQPGSGAGRARPDRSRARRFRARSADRPRPGGGAAEPA